MDVEMSFSEPQFYDLTNSNYYSGQAGSKPGTLGSFGQDDWDAIPATAKPVPIPMPDGYMYGAMFDPNLSITPEKMRLPPTLVKLNSAEGDDNDSFANFREMKVHFDQNVAVHHISPEVSTDLSTLVDVDSSLESNGSMSAEMLTASPENDGVLSRFSSYKPADVLPKDVSILSGSSDELMSGYSSKGDAYVSRCCDGDISTITKDLNALRAKDPELDLSIVNSFESCEPISVVASDLCTKNSKNSFKKSLDSRFYSGRQSQSMPIIKVNKNLPEKELNSFKELPVITGKSTTSDDVRCLLKDQPVGMLSQPELNSTLRLTKEMSSLKAKEFDVQAYLKDPKIKGRIHEKASVKLNADSAVYTNLLSLEVREEELLSRVAEAQLAKARPETGTRIKPENLVSRPPDILEFFGPDLQPEFASYTLFGIAPDHIETRTVDLDRAFDIYKRTRVWDRYDVNS